MTIVNDVDDINNAQHLKGLSFSVSLRSKLYYNLLIIHAVLQQIIN